jgi:pyrroloquinoline quinone biosynthesis protein B
MFEATPDMPKQIQQLIKHSGFKEKSIPDGIFLTHAHIGHYTGLMFLGKEAIGAKKCPVYAMPEMRSFLSSNGPWSQLITLNNIKLMDLKADSILQLSENISIIPFIVPHRDEFSETVGYQIISSNKSLLFIPDIDKWGKWNKNIIDEVKKHDHLLIDATFYQNKEVKGRDMSEIPHPFVEESISLFKDLPFEEKQKIIFIHFNHSNPLLDPESKESKFVESKGFKLARQLDVIPL